MSTTTSQPLSSPSVGQRFRLRRPASITSSPRGEAGMTGMVHAVGTSPGQEFISARMDQPLSDATTLLSAVDEVWQNCVEWKGADCASTFLSDCELLPSYPPVVGQRLRLMRDVDRDPYFLAKPGMTGTLTKVVLTPGAEFIQARMDQPLSADPERQASIEAEWGNCLEWDQPDFIAQFFVDCALYPAIGQRIRLRKPVDRFDSFLAMPGLTGMVLEVDPTPGEDFISAQMDQPLSDSPENQAHIEEEYHNCLHWYCVDTPELTYSALDDFLSECEYIEPDALETAVLNAPNQVIEGRLPGGRTCHIWKGLVLDIWQATVYCLDKPHPDLAWSARRCAELIAIGKKDHNLDLRDMVLKGGSQHV
jgi:hypothetical protein